MNAFSFDTHRIVKRLREAGFSDPQAETVTDVLREARSGDLSELATKQDLREAQAVNALEFKGLRSETERGFKDVRSEMDQGFKDVRSETDQGLKSVRSEMDQGFKDVRSEMDQGFKDVRSEMDQGFKALRAEMEILRRDMTIRLGGLIAAGVAFLAAIKLFD